MEVLFIFTSLACTKLEVLKARSSADRTSSTDDNAEKNEGKARAITLDTIWIALTLMETPTLSSVCPCLALPIQHPYREANTKSQENISSRKEKNSGISAM
jgi:hypothetical protein